MLKDRVDRGEALAMPDVSDMFASEATYVTTAAMSTKLAGSGDSVRNQKSEVKAPGGKDAARQRDGG